MVNRSFFKFLFKLSISIFCIWYLNRKIDWVSLEGYWQKINIFLVASSIMLLLGLSFLQALRWSLIIKTFGIRGLHLRLIIESVLIGTFFNQGLPSSIGGDVYRVWTLTKSKKLFKPIITSVFLDRLSSLLMMNFITMLLLIFFNELIDQRLFIYLIAMNSIIFTAAFFLFYIEKIVFFSKYKSLIFIRALFFLGKSFVKIFTTKDAKLIFALSMIIHIGISIVFWIIASQFTDKVDILTCIILVPIVLLTTMIPITLAGWGIRESIVIYLLGYLGVPSHESFLISIIFGLTIIASAIPGAIIWLTNRKRAINFVHT